MPDSTVLNASVNTNTGLVRSNNEDNFYLNGRFMSEAERGNLKASADIRPTLGIFAVCDGMGGENSGEKASFEAVCSLWDFQKQFSGKEFHIEELHRFVEETNDLIFNLAASDPDKRGMGTTLAGLVIHRGQAVAFNLGDSRVYLLRGERLAQMTSDHTEAERLIRMGVLEREKAREHKGKYMLTRHLGVSPEEGKMDADYSEVLAVRPGDLFLLCSDGLTDMVNDERIREILLSPDEPDVISGLLVNEAIKNGGADNITALVVKVGSTVAGLEEDFVENLEAASLDWLERTLERDKAGVVLRRKRKKKNDKKQVLLTLFFILLGICIGIAAVIFLFKLNSN